MFYIVACNLLVLSNSCAIEKLNCTEQYLNKTSVYQLTIEQAYYHPCVIVSVLFKLILYACSVAHPEVDIRVLSFLHIINVKINASLLQIHTVCKIKWNFVQLKIISESTNEIETRC